MQIKEIKILPRISRGLLGKARAEVRFRPETAADDHPEPGRPRCGGFRREFLPDLMILLQLDDHAVNLVPACELATRRQRGEDCENWQVCPCPAAFIDRAQRLANDVEVTYTEGSAATIRVCTLERSRLTGHETWTTQEVPQPAL